MFLHGHVFAVEREAGNVSGVAVLLVLEVGGELGDTEPVPAGIDGGALE